MILTITLTHNHLIVVEPNIFDLYLKQSLLFLSLLLLRDLLLDFRLDLSLDLLLRLDLDLPQ